MRLPKVKYGSGIRKVTQMKFTGLDATTGGGEGSLIDMENMSGDHYPVLASREKRVLLTMVGSPKALFAGGAWAAGPGLCYIGDGGFYVDGDRKGDVSPEHDYTTRSMARLGNYVVLMPDKKYYDMSREDVRGLPEEITSDVDGLTFQDGTLEGMEAKANTVYVYRAGFDALFKPGDKAVIAGCTAYPQNNKTLVVREATRDELRFEENSFTVGSDVDGYVKTQVPHIKTLQDMENGWTGRSLSFQNGTIFGEEAKANTIYAAGVNWEGYFREGDAVSISGCIKHPENNKTIIVREIDGAYLRFYENSFVLDGEDALTDYTENAVGLKLCRSIPDLKYICEHENRLWGTDGKTIFVSKLGDIFNWNVFDGLGTDSWAWTPGSEGEITGCCSYRGYPVFFKEDYIYKVYGSLPSNYEVLGSATMGLAQGCSRSLAVAGETLFYLGRTGVTAYQGGIPQSVAQIFGTEKFRNAVAGSDGTKYYVSMENEEGRWRLYVYDTRTGMWHIEDGTCAVGFARSEGVLYFLTDTGELWATREVDAQWCEAQPEMEVCWAAEFGDIAEDEPNKKGVSKLQIRMELEAGAWAQVYIQYDSDGMWQSVGKMLIGDGKRSVVLPIIPRRCDHFRVKLMGCGQCHIHSMAREYYVGSER